MIFASEAFDITDDIQHCFWFHFAWRPQAITYTR